MATVQPIYENVSLLLLKKRCVCEDNNGDSIVNVFDVTPVPVGISLNGMAAYAIQSLMTRYPRLYNTVRCNIIHSSATGIIAITAVPYDSDIGCSYCMTVSTPSDYLFAGFIISYLRSANLAVAVDQKRCSSDVLLFLKIAYSTYCMYTDCSKNTKK